MQVSGVGPGAEFSFVGQGFFLCVWGGGVQFFRPECGLVGVVLGVWVWVAEHKML